MKLNFKVGGSNELLCGDRRFDLHNFYCFVGVKCNGRTEVDLLFEPDPDFLRGNPPLRIEFRKVDFLEFNERLEDPGSWDIDELGYMMPEQTEDSWIVEQEYWSEMFHFYLRLQFPYFVRIHADEARLVAST